MFAVVVRQVGSPELAHSIAMDDLQTPHLLVLNATTAEHHLVTNVTANMTMEMVCEFLDDIHEERAPVGWRHVRTFLDILALTVICLYRCTVATRCWCDSTACTSSRTNRWRTCGAAIRC